MEAPLFLGIDLGTSGVRVALVDETGRPVALGRAPLPPSRRGKSGRVTQDPEAWWRAVERALLALPAELRLRAAAVALDGTSGTVLAVDAKDRPLGAARMYDDTAAGWAAEHIAAHAPAESGAHGAGSGLAKAMDLRRSHPEARILTQADWVARRLGVAEPLSDENNALKLGYDPVSRRWPEWVMALLDGLPLPGVVPPGTPVGRVTKAVAASLGLPAGIPIAAGTTDSVAATLAAGVRETGEAVTALGSTLALKLVSPRPVFDPHYGVYSHRVGEVWLAAGASNSGGAVLARFFSPDELAELSSRIDPERDSGWGYYPLNAPGERFPIHDPELAPRLTPRPDDPARFLHGLLEGIARIEQRGYALLGELAGVTLRRVWTTGGGAANTTWTALRARLLNVPVQPAVHREAAVGAARLARCALEGCPPLRLHPSIS